MYLLQTSAVPVSPDSPTGVTPPGHAPSDAQARVLTSGSCVKTREEATSLRRALDWTASSVLRGKYPELTITIYMTVPKKSLVGKRDSPTVYRVFHANKTQEWAFCKLL